MAISSMTSSIQLSMPPKSDSRLEGGGGGPDDLLSAESISLKYWRQFWLDLQMKM
jgi:hypothetical protein